MKRLVRPALVAIFAACAGLVALNALAQPQPKLVDPPKPSFTAKVVAVDDGEMLVVSQWTPLARS